MKRDPQIIAIWLAIAIICFTQIRSACHNYQMHHQLRGQIQQIQEQRNMLLSVRILIVGLADALLLSNLMHIAWHREMEAKIQAAQEIGTTSTAYNQPGGEGDALRDSQLHRADGWADNLPG